MSTHSTISPLRFFLFFTSLIASVFLVGCGGGSKKTDPAPSSLNGRTIRITDDTLTPAITAYTYVGATSGSYSGDNSDAGTFIYTKTVGTTDQAVLQMTGTFYPVPATFNLLFTSGGGGSYTTSLPSSGTFTIN